MTCAGNLSADLDQMAEATDRLLATVDDMTDEDLRAPSRLAGWSRAHVLTHIARNADGLCVLVENARTGQGLPMYAGGREGRDAEIEAGANRGLGDLRLDLTDSAERLLQAFADFPDEAADREIRLLSGATGSGADIPYLRTREVEIHHVDLGLGYSPASWDAAFARRTLEALAPLFRTERDCPVHWLVAGDEGQRWEVGREGPQLQGSPQDLLAWLTGRGSGGLTVEPAGDVPAAPRWA